MNNIDMENLGLSQRFVIEATLYKGLYIGRVISQYKNLYKVVTENGELKAEVSGKFLFEVKTVSDFPAVGDFVMLDRTEDTSGSNLVFVNSSLIHFLSFSFKKSPIQPCV